jgi:hypothetical protein
MAYHRVLDGLEMHVFESGHQLLETHHREGAALMSRFMLDVGAGAFGRLRSDGGKFGAMRVGNRGRRSSS